MVKSEESMITQVQNNLVPQAKLFAIGYLLLFVSMLMVIIVKKMFTKEVMLSIVFNVIVFALSVYVVNCTVTGSCHLYAWIVAYALVVLGVFASISTFFVISKN